MRRAAAISLIGLPVVPAGSRWRLLRSRGIDCAACQIDANVRLERGVSISRDAYIGEDCFLDSRGAPINIGEQTVISARCTITP
jgi:acetyltransferase-like isoleucine patch superfamily enzyme